MYPVSINFSLLDAHARFPQQHFSVLTLPDTELTNSLLMKSLVSSLERSVVAKLENDLSPEYDPILQN